LSNLLLSRYLVKLGIKDFISGYALPSFGCGTVIEILVAMARLGDSMKSLKEKDGYSPAFGKTQSELGLVKSARQTLASL
jgi:hypothetical protein